MLQCTAPRDGGKTSGVIWRERLTMTVQTKAPESQFAYVVLAARRARQLMAGAPPLVENPRTLKYTRVACEEIDYGLIEYEFDPGTNTEEDKDGNKRRK